MIQSQCKVGDNVRIIGNLNLIGNPYFSSSWIGRIVTISLKVDEGYEWLDENGFPWFVMVNDVRPLSKLDKALA